MEPAAESGTLADQDLGVSLDDLRLASEVKSGRNRRRKGSYGQGTERRLLPIAELHAHPLNPRSHPQEQIRRIAEAINRQGQVRLVLVRAENRQIIAGHGTVAALQMLGRSEADCLVWDCSQEEADRQLIADNRLAELGHDDAAKRAALLLKMPAADFLAVGFSADEVVKMLPKDPGIDAGQIVQVDTSTVRDEAWAMVACPLSLQADMLERLKKLMADLPEVTVEVGITNKYTG